jgi:hypothetical protein
MELDGYCATVRIAFEHQGEQHYSTKAHFLKSGFDLSRRQEDDALKSNLCTQRGIALVSVPEIPRLLPLSQVRAFIKEQLATKGIPLPRDIDAREVDVNKAYRTSGSREALSHLRSIAADHGGKCLSTSYAGAFTKLIWQCAKGHEWTAKPNNVQQGGWCPYCAGHIKKTIEDMKDLATQHGGQCLSRVYKNNRSKLVWQCQLGHQWETTPGTVVRGRWCPKCGVSRGGLSRRLGLLEMKSIAASRGGLCLSDEYVNTDTNLLWQCKEGHQWKAIPDSIKRGTWCPVCGRRRQGRHRTR